MVKQQVKLAVGEAVTVRREKWKRKAARMRRGAAMQM
jgi:hypothetical protein